MSEETSIQVNFGKALPIFPLDKVTLLPQQVLPLHIFEPRYRQMIEHALDGAGQFAMAVFDGAAWKQQYHGNPPVRPAVCVGQIMQHEKLPDGRFNVVIQGVCRARIVSELPAEQGRRYRMAMLEPVGLENARSEPEESEGEAATYVGESTPFLSEARERMREMLSEGPLTQMTVAKDVLEYVKNADFHPSALLELVSFTLISDDGLRYRLLAEPSADNRAKMILHELDHLSSLIRRAAAQHPEDWPKGCSWN
ncbi:MAG: hypothetical protein GC200_12265 [Tepidisphaera sp.]|nr:hypothetical protein [Tepidisphaera sp.]